MSAEYAEMPKGEYLEFRHPDGTTRKLVAYYNPNKRGRSAEYTFDDGTTEEIPGRDLACAIYHQIRNCYEGRKQEKINEALSKCDVQNVLDMLAQLAREAKGMWEEGGEALAQYIEYGDFLKDLAHRLRDEQP